MTASRLTAAAALALSLSACAGAAAPAVGPSLAFPTGATRSLAAATLYTSPDGGIYQNPDPVQVLMITRRPGAPIVRELGAPAAAWAALESLGDFTFVGVRIRDGGAAGSDPQLNSVQIASDYAPGAAASGPLRHFYHPMFPLALLSAATSDTNCGIHLDPGREAVVVLVYPPIRDTTSIVWGIYQAFALRAPLGGALPAGTGGWHATACTPPQAVPAPPAA